MAALEKGCSHITKPFREPGCIAVGWGVAMDHIEVGIEGCFWQRVKHIDLKS